MRNIVKILFPLGMIGIAIMWIIIGVSSGGIWDSASGPGRNFYPVLVASGMLLSALFALAADFRGKGPVFKKDEGILIVGAILIFTFSFIIGMLPTLLIFCVLWLRMFEKYPWRTTLLVTGILSAIIYGVFVMWLRVRFPLGLFRFLIY